MERTRNAEYLQICLALEDLKKIEDGIMPEKVLVYKAIQYLQDRKIAVEPTGSKNRRSPK